MGDVPDHVSSKYFYIYPDEEKLLKSKILFTIRKYKDESEEELRDEIEKIVSDKDPEHRYKGYYIRQVIGQSPNGSLFLSNQEEFSVEQTLLWYIVEQNYLDLADFLISKYNTKITFSLQKLINKRLSENQMSEHHKQYFAAGNRPEFYEDLSGCNSNDLRAFAERHHLKIDDGKVKNKKKRSFTKNVKLKNQKGKKS